MTKLITAKKLRVKGASCGQVDIFEKEWPDGVRVTKKNLLRAVELGLDIHWFARHFLGKPFQEEYREKIAPAWKEYWEKEAPIRKEYWEKTALLIYELWERNEVSNG